MNKTSSTTSTSSSSRRWSDLPGELVLEVANRLALIELYSFRGVCKDWRTATSKASAIVPPQSQPSPWLLTHETDNPLSTFYNPLDQARYTTNLPELASSTCIASNYGWLLLFQAGKIFFFSPFSRAKILLPAFPSLKVTDHVAVFTGPPTSEECTICVIHRIDSLRTEMNMLSRGDHAWNTVNRECDVLGKVVGATYNKGKFYFLDENNKLVTYETGKKLWMRYTIVFERTAQVVESLPFSYCTRYFEKSGVRKMLDLGDETSVSVCGGATREGHIVLNEKIEAAVAKEEEGGLKRRLRQLKGVWVVQPRVPPVVHDEHIW